MTGPAIRLEEAEALEGLNGAEYERRDGYIPPGNVDAPSRLMVIEWFSDAADTALVEPNNPLIDGVLDEGAMSVLYGDSNSGKSFIALDMACRVSTGTPWNGHATKRGLVIYIAAEGGSRIKRRIAALQQKYLDEYGENAIEPLFALIRYPIDLRTNETDVGKLLALIRSAEEQTFEKCVWIIVDTLSRAMAGGDENSPVDMGRIVALADKVRDETKAHFSFVHHTGKDAARGARGHSCLRAATDTEIEVTPGSFTATKQRDLECGFALGFRLVDRILGADQEGREIKSAVVEWHAASAAKKEPGDIVIPPQARLLMDIVRAAIDEGGSQIRPFQDGPLVKAAADPAIRERFYARIAEMAKGDEDLRKVAERQRKAFNLAIGGLIKRKLIIAGAWSGERWIWLP